MNHVYFIYDQTCFSTLAFCSSLSAKAPSVAGGAVMVWPNLLGGCEQTLRSLVLFSMMALACKSPC